MDLALEGSSGNLAKAAEALARFGAPANVVSAVGAMRGRPQDLIDAGKLENLRKRP